LGAPTNRIRYIQINQNPLRRLLIQTRITIKPYQEVKMLTSIKINPPNMSATDRRKIGTNAPRKAP